MKWEPLALMALVIALGLWLVSWQPGMPERREGATLVKIQLGAEKGALEILRPRGDQNLDHATYRFIFRAGAASQVLSADELRRLLPPQQFERLSRSQTNWAFRLLNISTWGSLLWVGLGLIGQLAFSGRFLVQWMLSEKERRSVVPAVFWWLSLCGGVLLFAYFAWRQDLIGVLGQSSGLVVYARNLRLIQKEKRRAIKREAKAHDSESRSGTL